ncbi:hypothetical protein [Albibacterium profundi]|uniref:GIY-YIG domain-containing protein n=1 Tax=Albibacterium profundi TaxID=3134906 RepID=A0ABV5CFX6_9SPHI
MHDISWNAKRGRRQEIKEHIRKFLLYPGFWNDSSKHIKHKIKWEKILFEDGNATSIPNKKGVYCFVVEPPVVDFIFETRYLFYIGKASSATLRARYKNYVDEKNNVGIGNQKPRIKVQEMLNDYYGHIYFFYAELNADLVKDIEEKLLNMYMPYVNTSIPELKISEEYKHIYS